MAILSLNGRKKSFAFLLGSLLSWSGVAQSVNISYEAVEQLTPVGVPYNINACLPAQIPTGATGGVLNINNYTSGNIVSNPDHKRRLLTSIGYGSLSFTDYFGFSLGFATIAHSDDRGVNWEYSYIPLTPCLGEHISQTGGGASLAYDHKGERVFAVGTFDDTNLFEGEQYLRRGIWVSSSKNDGQTWADAKVLATLPALNEYDSAGVTFIGGGNSVATDLEHHGIAYIANAIAEFPTTFYGSIAFIRTQDHFNEWSQLRVIYDMATDPAWLAQYTNPNLDRQGGQSLAPTLLDIPNPGSGDPILLATFLRIYPTADATTYTQNIDNPGDSLTDIALIRSFDHGKNWEQVATVVAPFNLGLSHDPTQPVVNGILVNDSSLNNFSAYSKSTGRVYVAFQAATIAPSEEDPVPESDEILITVSNNQGTSWSPTVKINRTPTSIIPGASQVFNPNIAVLDNGYLGVIYYDYRNFTAGPVIPTDAWLAIYKETTSPTGGSTGIGLDFVQEIRLTATSFDAAIGYASLVNAAAGGPGIVKNSDNFRFTFNQTGTNNLPTTVVDGVTVDSNNRFNDFVGNVDVDE